jgi:PhnB protein
MAIALSGTDRERISRLFGELGEGGRIKGPLTEQPWGGATGYREDRFGMKWVVSVEKA